MYREISLILAFGVLFTFLQNGHALRCWKCNSEYDITCRDFFNKTRIEENRRYFENVNYGNRQIQPVRNDPHVETCDEMYTTSYNQKNVCVKRVYKGNKGIPEVYRGCRLVSKNLKSGECPEDLTDKSKEMHYCGTCETDECNAAGSVKTSIFLAVAAPIITIMLLRN